MRRWTMAVALAVGLMSSACGPSSDEDLATFDHAVRGERVEPDSFLSALRGSFRTGSTAAVSFDVRGGVGLRGEGTVRYTNDAMDSDLRVEDWKLEGASVEIRTVGGTTYMRVPESRGLWVNLDDAGAGVPGVDLADDADPRRAVDDLRADIDEIRFSGTETIGGVRARRFQVVTKPDAGSGTGSGRPTVTEYWFDGRDRVVRRHSELDQASEATFTWTRWGKPVTISRPKPGTVITLKRLEQLRKQQ